jgi:hypothetical protein
MFARYLNTTVRLGHSRRTGRRGSFMGSILGFGVMIGIHDALRRSLTMMVTTIMRDESLLCARFDNIPLA